MTLKIPVVFDPDTRLIVEDPTGSSAPFEAKSDVTLLAGNFVSVYSDAGVRKIRVADAASGYYATGYVLSTATNLATVFTSGINKEVPTFQGDGVGGGYTFTAADLGTSVYLDNTNSGKLTKILPSSSNFQRIGEVVGVGTTTMEIVFKPSFITPQDTLIYKGTWDASINNPALGSTPPGGSKGWYYVVSVQGTTSLGGINVWSPGDWVLSDGLVWSKIDNSNGLQLATAGLPVALGTAALGSSPYAAALDHVHPDITNTTLQRILADGGGAVPVADGVAGVGDSLFAARENHVHPKNIVKSPIRYFYETPLALTDQQPALRIDAAGKIVAIRYYAPTGSTGTGTIVVYKNGVALSTLSLSLGDSGFVTKSGFSEVALSVGDIISIAVTGAGTATKVTIQLDIEQYA